ncbi:MAG TPA: chemotaxis protein CheB, partial [Bdellovibrio sp.]|uniref:chemotaxis protein CheB n=1 Tax=Bdellovibrio sp. TaxID=28201 RepID=UPI002EDD0563
GKNALGVVLTGMGKDGAGGLLEMKNAGAYTVAQNEETCVVYGMPAAAVALGAADKILPLDKIAGDLLKQVSVRNAA